MIDPSSRPKAILQALFVTFLWSTSWVLIKIGLQEIPALTFAGLRYSLAFILLLPFALRPAARAALMGLGRDDWLRLGLLGLLYYAITQGSQFVGLAYLPAVTVSLLLNFSPVLVAVLGIGLLGERPARLQWIGAGLFIVGAVVYFRPEAWGSGEGQFLGVSVTLAGVLANALSSIFGRRVNREGRLSALTVTTASMGVGSLALLVSGLAVQGMPRLSPEGWALLGWLAAVNTAFAFTLWNRTMRTLSAMESSIINNTMLVQIALLAWLFLGESLSGGEILALLLSAAGALLVQIGGARRG